MRAGTVLHNALEKLRVRLCSTCANVSLPKTWTPESIKEFIAKCFIERSSEQSVLAERAAAYISEHYNEPITQSDVAQMLGVTPAYLSSVFHETKGKTSHNLRRFFTVFLKKITPF